LIARGVQLTISMVSRTAKPKAGRRRRAPVHAEAVGTAEFRANLAKYLKQASAGRPVIVQGRGRSAYVLSKLEDAAPPSIVGCMRERTEYAAREVVNASEQWRSGAIP
jgi:prevent-host-death family protein